MKQVSWIRRISLLIGLILLMASTHLAYASSGITVTADPGIEAQTIELINKTVASFNEIIQKEMKVSLYRDVRVFLCQTDESYINVLRKQFKFSKKEAIAHAGNSIGMSMDESAIIVVKLDSRNSKWLTLSVTAHELAHQLQADLSYSYSGRTLRWMREGTAEVIAATIISKCGYQSFGKWRNDEINYFRSFKDYAAPEDMGYIDLDEWDKLIVNRKHPYEISELLVFNLMKTTKRNFYEAMAEYYKNACIKVDDTLSFEESFGIPLKEFNEISKQWLAQTKEEAARMEIVTDNKSSIAQDLAAAFELSQSFMKEKLGTNLHSHQRIITASNKNDYIATLCREFGMTQSRAEELAERGTWRFSNGTTIIEIGTYPDRQKRFYRVGNIMMKKLLGEQVSSRLESGTFWFRNGSAEVFAAMFIEQAGLAPVENYRKGWRAALDKKELKPTIGELETTKQWDSAVEKYGEESVIAYASLATEYLLESKGTESITQWLKSIKEVSDSQAAFEKELKMTPKEFEIAFQKQLESMENSGVKQSK